MFDFDEVVDRKGTNCASKWDTIEANNNPKMCYLCGLDMVASNHQVKLKCFGLVKRGKQGVYGYSFAPDEYFDAVISWMKKKT